MATPNEMNGMKPALLLLAGYPATGKTDLSARIMARHPGQFEIISPDEVKEEVWDEIGFDSAADKTALEDVIWARYYERLDACMANRGSIISEYPFSDKQKDPLASLVARHGYRVLTIRLVGDPHVIYARSRQRDLSPRRHLGHLVSRFHRGDTLEDRSTADAFVSRELFLERCTTKGYQCFKLGALLELDATDLARIDYPGLLDQIDEFITGQTQGERYAQLMAGVNYTDEELASRIDYTSLKATVTRSEIDQLCADALRWKTASVCIAPSWVKHVHTQFSKLRICTVVGFPLGNSLSTTKAAEAAQSVELGAREIDMVVNLGWVRDREYNRVARDIACVREAIGDEITLKVIVETCYLSMEEKRTLIDLVGDSEADFIKTSTGFGTAGAQLDDVQLFAQHIHGRSKIKAAGGIRTRDDLCLFVHAGADRIGCSTPFEQLFH